MAGGLGGMVRGAGGCVCGDNTIAFDGYKVRTTNSNAGRQCMRLEGAAGARTLCYPPSNNRCAEAGMPLGRVLCGQLGFGRDAWRGPLERGSCSRHISRSSAPPPRLAPACSAEPSCHRLACCMQAAPQQCCFNKPAAVLPIHFIVHSVLYL